MAKPLEQLFTLTVSAFSLPIHFQLILLLLPIHSSKAALTKVHIDLHITMANGHFSTVLTQLVDPSLIRVILFFASMP